MQDLLLFLQQYVWCGSSCMCNRAVTTDTRQQGLKCCFARLQVWGRCEALTAGLSSDLAEQLRLVLEPQLASKMAGEYRTGKRISMKRVIAYIASHFRKDKIWLRRTRPDKRKYQASCSGRSLLCSKRLRPLLYGNCTAHYAHARHYMLPQMVTLLC